MPVKLSWRTRIEKLERERAPDKGLGLGPIWLRADLSDSEVQMADEMIARGEMPDERFLFWRPGEGRRI
jgi:hypothetical protein